MIFLFIVFWIFPSIYGAPDKFVGLETKVNKHKADIEFILKNIETLVARFDQLVAQRDNESSSDIQSLRGEKGETGEPGITGIPGLPGRRGVSGGIGPIGETGLRGAPGEKGERGNNGRPGETGTNGMPGLPGPPGVQGDVGPIGPPGPPGLPGLDGENGDDGYPGPQGDRGETGFPGLPGWIVDDKGYCILALGDCPPTFKQIEKNQAHVEQYQFGNQNLVKSGGIDEDEKKFVLKVTTCCR